jgi:soluble lytic murein transglycosylase
MMTITRAAIVSLWLAIGVAATQPVHAAADDAPAAIDAQLAPIFAELPGSSELATIKTAIQSVYSKKFTEAERIAAGIGNATGRKLVRWFELRSGAPYAAASEMRDFHRQYPGWPDDALQAQAEVTLLKSGAPKDILDFFADGGPATGAGRMAVACALAETGRQGDATKQARAAWRDDDFGPEGEAAALKRGGALLTAADHKARADRLLYDDSRWEVERAKRVAGVQRLIPLLTPDDAAKIQARIAVYRCYRGGPCAGPARVALNKLPASANKDWGIVYHRIQLLRRSNRDGEAWRLMATVPGDAAGLISPDDWWLERRMNIYTALYAGENATAYKIAADAGKVGVNARKDSTFMAGFIALRRLNQPKQALKHFEAMRAAADGPIGLAQADYWLGRTQETLGAKDKAQEHFKAASAWFNTYYGQLARHKIDAKNTRLSLRATKVPSDKAVRAFLARDAVRALVIAQKAGLNDLMRVFMLDLRQKLDNEGEYVLLSHLALKMGDTQMSVRVAKTAMDRGFDLTNYAYPTVGMPKFTPLRPLGDMAIYYAVARQESEFNTLTLSGAGARGVLQVMPVAARDVCRAYKQKCDNNRLMTDPAYNASLGSAYIADRIEDFGGSYVLGFAGYNAGPGRARQWIQSIGDPRDPRVDPVDWVEMVHIEETRDYIKKVTANLQVYRARLGDARPLRISTDITRARPGVGEN